MNKTKFFSSLLVGLLVTTGLFTSCKDYDDDIKNLQQQIDQKSLKTDLESLKSSLEARLATLESTLNTKEAALKAEIAKKANQTDLDALTTVVNGKANQSALDAEIAARVKAVEDLTAEIAGIKTKIATIEATLGTKADQSALDALKLVVDQKADKTALEAAYNELLAKITENARGDQADEEALQTAIATLTGKINERLTEAQVKAIVDESAAAQTLALQTLKSEINEKLESLGLTKADIEKLTDVNNKIAAIEDALKAFTGAETIEEAKEKMQELAEKIDENIAAIDVLEAFVQKQLTSMVLMPSFYWEGLEGIEVPFGITTNFVPKKDYEFKYKTTGALGDEEITVKVAEAMTFGCMDKDGKASSILAEVAIADNGPWAGTAAGQAGPKNLTLAIAEKLKEKAVYEKVVSIDTISLMQGGIAKYHYNPSTANLEGYKFSFFENDAEVYTRAAGAIVATPREADIAYENGILTVPFDVDGGKLQSMFDEWIAGNVVLRTDQKPAVGAIGTAFGGGKKLPFLAAQMAKGDTIVTSDYGVIVPVTIDIIALADKAPLEKLSNGVNTEFKKPVANAACPGNIRDNHLYESVGYKDIVIPATGVRNNYGAITMPATHEIVYSEKAFDLAQFVETHAKYTHYAKYGVSDNEVVLSKEELAALGLHYEFNIIDYTKANEKTGQSKHIIRVDANGAPSNDKEVGYFSVRSVDKDGNTMVNATATQETVGREPLIRVDLVNKDGKIIRYGYIKLLIVKDAAKDVSVTVDFGDIYMNCGGQAKMTWSEMENIILREIDMTKEDFEKLYHLDVIGNHDHMPYVNQAPEGTLYDKAAANKWMAKRYVKGEDGKYVLAMVNEEAAATDDDNLAMMAEYTADNNWFGRVWYTPHDNLTETQKWDENTNVLEWNFGSDRTTKNETLTDASNMKETAYYQMMKVVDATYNSKGLNKNELSTVVRFIHKNGSSIYVTLKFAPGKIHFAWGDINNRVLDHWYDFANGYQENTRDTIEVYANVPTPALRNNEPLTVNNFTKDLKEYWLNSNVVPDIHDLTNKEDGRFNKFWNYTNKKTSEGSFNGTVSFQFRLPVKGDDTTVQNENGEWINSKTVQYETNTKEMKIQNVPYEAGKAFTWKVKGASGKTYTLYLAYKADPTTGLGAYSGKTGNQIVALKDNKAADKDEVICHITANGVIKYNGWDPQTKNSKETNIAETAVNSAATDILNYVGMYDATGKLIKDDYLDGQNGTDNKAFTAFVEIKVSAKNCYDPLMGKNCFNVRFLRPVNMWPAQTEWTDAPNDTQIYPLWKLVYIRDWRQFPVVPLDAEQQFGKAAKAGTGEDGKTYKGQIKAGTDGIVTYQFYSISNLYVKRADIRSDAYLSADNRTILTDPAKIAALKTIDQIPALTGTNASDPTAPKWQFLKIFAKQAAAAPKTWEETTAEAAGKTALGLDESNSYENVLAYTNNSGVVKEFHIYVPVSLKYPWGSVTDWTQKVWAVITVKPTTGNE